MLSVMQASEKSICCFRFQSPFSVAQIPGALSVLRTQNPTRNFRTPLYWVIELSFTLDWVLAEWRFTTQWQDMWSWCPHLHTAFGCWGNLLVEWRNAHLKYAARAICGRLGGEKVQHQVVILPISTAVLPNPWVTTHHWKAKVAHSPLRGMAQFQVFRQPCGHPMPI